MDYLLCLVLMTITWTPAFQNPAPAPIDYYAYEENWCVDGPDLIWYIMMPDQPADMDTMGRESLTILFTLIDLGVDGFQSVNWTSFRDFWVPCTSMFEEDTRYIFKMFAEAVKDDNHTDVVMTNDLDAFWNVRLDPDGDHILTYDDYFDIWIDEIIPKLPHRACPDENVLFSTTIFNPVCARFTAGGF